MKKNNVMRVFSLLLALTLISVCAISGTFAKYVTRASGEDSARVAKWGVVLGIDGTEAFGTQYAAQDRGYLAAGGEYSVVSSNGDAVVAPGTSSELLGTNLVATVKGTPEVAARYSIEGNVEDIVLKADTYTDYTNLVIKDGKYGYTDTFTLEKDYSPVKWNLIIEGKGRTFNVATELYKALPANLIAAAENYGLTREGCSFFSAIEILKKVAGGNYQSVIDNALKNIVSGGRNFQLDATDDGFVMSYDFDPNKEMDYTFTLSWEWKFEQKVQTGEDNEGNPTYDTTNVDLYDKADTFLGNWAAVELGQQIEGFVAPTNGSSYEIGATLTATAVQID